MSPGRFFITLKSPTRLEPIGTSAALLRWKVGLWVMIPVRWQSNSTGQFADYNPDVSRDAAKVGRVNVRPILFSLKTITSPAA